MGESGDGTSAISMDCCAEDHDELASAYKAPLSSCSIDHSEGSGQAGRALLRRYLYDIASGAIHRFTASQGFARSWFH